MDGNELKKDIKRDLAFGIIVLSILLIVHICFDIYVIKTFSDNQNSRIEDYVFSISGAIAMLLCVIREISFVFPALKDVIFYKDHDVEKMRAIIIKIRSAIHQTYVITAKNLETGKELLFKFSTKDVEMDKVYDFIYLKYSMVFKYKPVSFEQLTEDNREKASKIDFNQKD